jgi:phosphoglycerate dehydrogenase-like enzyme
MYQVYRSDLSAYFSQDLINVEKNAIEKIAGLKYFRKIEELSLETPTILLTNSQTNLHRLPEKLIRNVSCILHPNSGVDNLDLELTRERNILVIRGNPIRSQAVTEYTLAALMQHYSFIPHHSIWDDQRTWERKLIRDLNILVIGAGHIGYKVAQSLKVMGVKNLNVYDPHKNVSAFFQQYSDLKQIDKSSIDCLIVCCELNTSSHAMINQDFFTKLKSDALIINPARGKIIKELDLLAFLKKNPKAKAYLDVFEQEPFVARDYSEVQNLNRTSHIAGVFSNLKNEMLDFEIKILTDFMKFQNDISSFKRMYQDLICE